MFKHNYIYSLRLMLRNKQLVFWTMAFPLIMAMLFNMALSNVESSEKTEPVRIAVVNDDNFKNNQIYKEAFNELSKGDDRVFDIKYTDADNAKKLLSDEEITGYIAFKNFKPEITINRNGIKETIMTYVVNEITCQSNVMIKLAFNKISDEISNGNYNNIQKIFEEQSQKAFNGEDGIKTVTPKNMSFVMIEYYSLIAMSCMYSGLFTLTLMNYLMANISAVGKRSTVSSARKSGMIFGSFGAAFTIQLFGLLLLYLLLIFGIRADFGSNVPYVILISLLGSAAGLSLGTAIAVLVKKSENAKFTVLIAVVMAGCFLSGMMGITMKNVIDKNAPVLNKINPVAMITDGLYSIYYYNSNERFIVDAVSLVIFSAVMLLISLRGLRRQRYDSI